MNHVPSIPSLARNADVTMIPKTRLTTRHMLQATSRSNYTRCSSPLCRVYHVREGEITIKSLRATALFTGWRGIWMRRLTSAIVLGSYQACCSVCPVEGSAELYPATGPHRSFPSWDRRYRHNHSLGPPATSGLQTGIAYARGNAFTMVRMLVAKL